MITITFTPILRNQYPCMIAFRSTIDGIGLFHARKAMEGGLYICDDNMVDAFVAVMRQHTTNVVVHTVEYVRMTYRLPPLAPPPQWFVDQHASDMDDQSLAEWLTGCGPKWATIAETHMRCIGKIDQSLRKAIRRGWITPGADRS